MQSITKENQCPALVLCLNFELAMTPAWYRKNFIVDVFLVFELVIGSMASRTSATSSKY